MIDIQVDDAGLVVLATNPSRVCGYLLELQGKVFDADLGRVEVTPEQAKEHNRVFDEMIVDGLAKCPIGKGNTFYHQEHEGTHQVITWWGTMIDPRARVAGQTITFQYRGMIFRGRLGREHECFNFRRIR